MNDHQYFLKERFFCLCHYIEKFFCEYDVIFNLNDVTKIIFFIWNIFCYSVRKSIEHQGRSINNEWEIWKMAYFSMCHVICDHYDAIKSIFFYMDSSCTRNLCKPAFITSISSSRFMVSVVKVLTKTRTLICCWIY